MAKTPYLSVIIPCYNEEKNIRRGVIKEVSNFLSLQKYDYEVIVVDDGSTDGSRELLKKQIEDLRAFSLIYSSHQGKAKAVASGVLRATGSIILFCDFDQATPLSEIKRLLPYFSDHDIVIGSRSNQRKGAPYSRILMARGFMTLRNLILNLAIFDTQCGFKAFKGDVAHKLFKKLKLYKGKLSSGTSHVTAGFDVELLYIARKLGFRVKEMPVEWKYVETRRVSPIRDSWEGFIDLLRIKYNDLRGLYD